jgi:hypothetical protein
MTLPDKQQHIIQKPPFKVFRETNKINSKQTIKKKITTTTTTAKPQHKKDFCRKKIELPETEGCAIRTNDRFPFVR